MNAGDWIAVASAVIAAAGAFFAWRQAGLAKRSAQAADRQATAAEEQVAIMQQQLKNETTDRYEAAAPCFAVKSAVIEDDPWGQHIARLTIEQTGGMAVSDVDVTAQDQGCVLGLLAHPRGTEPDYTTGGITWIGSAPGSEHQVTANLRYDLTEPVNVILDFTSRQAETGREWKCTLTAAARRPPPPSRYRVYNENY